MKVALSEINTVRVHTSFFLNYEQSSVFLGNYARVKMFNYTSQRHAAWCNPSYPEKTPEMFKNLCHVQSFNTFIALNRPNVIHAQTLSFFRKITNFFSPYRDLCPVPKMKQNVRNQKFCKTIIGTKGGYYVQPMR